MSLILAPFSLLLNLLYGVFNSYGLALMCFAVFVKILLFPFSLKGKKGMIQMNMLSGQMTQLKKKYGKDPKKYNEEVTALYAREQVNPMGGCLWTILPLFVLFPLYAVIKEPLTNISGLTEEQILLLANDVNWDTVAVQLQLVTQDAIDKNIQKCVEAGASVVSGFTEDVYNQLYLASMIPEMGITLSDGTVVEYMNFHFMGMDLTTVPNWKLWEDLSMQNIVGLILVAISACTGLLFSKVAQKTNKLSQTQERNEQMEQSQRMMMYTMPIMSIWIGLIMPSLMVVYWVTNNLLSMVQELVAGIILKKDYEEALAVAERHKLEAKEQERKEKDAKRAEIERKKLEQQNNKGKKKKKEKKLEEPVVKLDKEASREGLRQYARGRNYDPSRYPNPYEFDLAFQSGNESPLSLEKSSGESSVDLTKRQDLDDLDEVDLEEVDDVEEVAETEEESKD